MPEPRRERKVVTVLFADLVGFTARSEQLDPEDVEAILRPYHARLRLELERFGGTVEKFIGDAVMALFGAPAAHEDDPERAVRAALAIRDWARAEGAVEVRIAVNTGEALIKLGARPELGEAMAAGDVVNTAARLQAGAPVNGVLVGDATYRATRGVIAYRAAEAVEAKGKAAAISVWEAEGPRSRVGSEAVSVRAPLVGRQRELDQLIDAFDRMREDRSAQFVTLVGVPGIGKSRLVAELLAHVEALHDPVHWRHGRSLPYGEGVTFWALAEIVKAQAGILENDPPAAVAEKLHRAVEEVVEASEQKWIESRLRPLLGLGDGEAAEGREDAFAAWRTFLESIAEQRPLVLVFEDLHWAGDELLDFVDSLPEWSADVPLLVLGTARPELLTRRPGWGGGKRNGLTISLSPLAADDTARLIAALLDRAVLAAETQSELLLRAGGNPLYAEQFARMLAERGELGHELPENVQGIIAARLDSLPEAEKRMLQDAAVVGKVFWTSSLAPIGAGDPTVVEEQLRSLTRKDFIRRERHASIEGESEYSFTHILVRDVAYGQIPRGERSRKHRRAAEWIETRARTDDLAELMAHHYLNALELARAAGLSSDDLLPRTVERLQRAGERARQLYANEDAAAYIRRALALLEEAPADAGWRIELAPALEESLGDVLELTGSHANGESAFGAALRHVSNRDRLRTARLLRKQALSRQLQRRIDDARETFAAADDALGDEPLGPSWWHERCEIAIQRLQLLYFGAPLETFAPEVERVRPMVEARGTASQRRFLYSHIGMVALRRDRYVAGDNALQHHRAALAAAREGGGLAEIAHMHFAYGFCLLWARQLDQAEAEITEGLALAERIGDATTRVRCLNYLSVIERWRGNVEAARELANRTLETARRAEMLEYVFQARAMLAWVAWRDGDRDLAEVEASAVSTDWDEFLGQRFLAWMPHWPLLAVALARGDEAVAAMHARRIVDPARQPMPPDLESMLASAVTASDRGEREAARESLAAAAQLAGGYGYL